MLLVISLCFDGIVDARSNVGDVCNELVVLGAELIGVAERNAGSDGAVEGYGGHSLKSVAATEFLLRLALVDMILDDEVVAILRKRLEVFDFGHGDKGGAMNEKFPARAAAADSDLVDNCV